MKKRRIQVFIEHDILIRHFLHNGTLQRLEERFHVQYVFPEDHQRIKSDVDSLGLTSVEKIRVDSKRVNALRDLAKIQTLHRASRKGGAYRFVTRHWKTVLEPSYYKYLRQRSHWFVFPFYKRKVLREAGRFLEMEEVIDAFQPDLVIHPSVLEGLFITDLTQVTRERGIPFLVLMNSWDNPSLKSLVVDPPDWLWVWGEQTKNHAVDFMGIDPSQVHIGGSAQFEVYREKPRITPEEFRARLGLPADRKLVVYAGSSKGVNEIAHLQILEKAVADGALENTHILFRPHPWRSPQQGEPDFFDLQWKHTTMDPSMTGSYNSPKNPEKRKIHLSDYRDTHDLLSCVDVMVSNVSTIMLEAALHEVPAVCVATESELASAKHLQAIFQARFFREIFTHLEVPHCARHEDIPETCRQALEDRASPERRRALKERTRFFVDNGGRAYPERLLDFACELAENRKAV